MIRSLAFVIAIMVCSAGVSHAASDGGNSALAKAYEKYAGGLNESDADKAWAVVDPDCVFIDENGRRETVEAVLPRTKDFLSNIRNNKFSYTINAVKSAKGKLIAYVNSEARFDLHSQMLFSDDWTPKVRSRSTVDTWEKKGGAWKLVESRSIRPEELHDMDTAATGDAPGTVSPVKFVKQNTCAKKCADALMSCSTDARESDEAATAKCVGENASCMSSCRQ